MQNQWNEPLPFRMNELQGMGFDPISIRALIYRRILIGVGNCDPLDSDSLWTLNVDVLCEGHATDESTFAIESKSDRLTVREANASNRNAAPIPRWDVEARVLEYRGSPVKSFRCPAQNQEAILCAFEEEGWPNRISDPLPPVDELNTKQRLHDAIRSLNRNQANRLIRFGGDGTGEGIVWTEC
ncbi:MAG: hypothetical protein U0892_04355 [Pirellulales bacterium]